MLDLDDKIIKYVMKLRFVIKNQTNEWTLGERLKSQQLSWGF